ncbi:MAG: hypothetical protein QM758_15430 [Armatimonas sp.]
MREEELAKRLQNAFPNTAPPDDALHARIRSLQSKAKTPRRKATWKRVLGGLATAGIGAVAISRGAVVSVLLQMEHAPAAQSVAITTVHQDGFGYSNTRQYWESPKGQKSIAIAATNGKPWSTQYTVRNGNKIYFWTRGYESKGEVYTKLAPLLQEPPQNICVTKSFLIPWIVRLPDKIVNGRRQWMLQQTYTLPTRSVSEPVAIGARLDTGLHKFVWQIDAKLAKVTRTENWVYRTNDTWHLQTFSTGNYNQPMPDSFFDIPSTVKWTPNSKPAGMGHSSLFEPYQGNVSFRAWWHDILVGQ